MATSAAIVTGFPNLGDGSVSQPSLAFQSDSDTGLYRIGANTIGIATNGTRVGEIGVGYGGFTGNVIQVVRTVGTNNYSYSSLTTITDLNTTFTPKYSNSLIIITVEGYFDSSASGVTPGTGFEILINGVSKKINFYGAQSISFLANSMTMSYSEILTSNASISITINCAPYSGTNACILYGSNPGRMHYLTVMEIQR